MLSASIRIYASPLDTEPSGAGFLLDPRHAGASLMACCSTGSNPRVVAGRVSAAAKLIWSSKAADVAILELDRPLGSASATLAPAKLWRQGQTVYRIAYESSGEPAIASAKIQGIATPPGSPPGIKTSTAASESIAGGALYDACGNVTGIGTAAAAGQPDASAVDPMVAGIVSAGIPVTLAVKPCIATGSATGSGGLLKSGLWIAGILVASCAGWTGTRWMVGQRVPQTTRAMNPAAPPSFQTLPEAASPTPRQEPKIAPKPFLQAIAGQYMGAAFALDAGASTLGRDPQASNLVFGSDSDSISKRHCTVLWDPGRQIFVIEDHGSTNGTYLSTGERLMPNLPRDLRPGDRFYIGDLRNQFEVILDI
jgi:hypothetical protein